ncbi:matrixin family metalloprotease [Paenibacillus sp. FSL R7-0297]|uniref:matrixin family metalloprotease n=1 Tax=unclassified Paenibacillus TaxID=185978 RepID=UPI0004F5957C|nr:matrixin family metalloprotease [Paenibacillus sp. FSL R5-0912]AIQ40803.1 hypothetical protein R50912_12805 [Paenibacillus sp. FSL R5-0912]
MMKKNGFRKIVSLGIILCCFFLGIGSAYAYNFVHDAGYRPHPSSGGAIVVRPFNGFDSNSITAMQNGASQWNAAGAGTLISIGATSTNTAYPNDNDLNQVTRGERGTNEYLQQTHYTTSGWVYDGLWPRKALYEADIDVNVSHPWSNNPAGHPDFYDVGNSFTHELGHLLGLDHSTVAGATMISGSSKGTIYKRDLADDDKSAIVDLY